MGSVLTAEEFRRQYKILGRVMGYGDWLIGVDKRWSDEAGGYEWFARLYR
ncbi:MAG: hypothetical protein SPI12_05470 [Actinomycetaceae bacterium]|nr:hypothetical protein [Actinomycetaceae bacterium]MDY6083290.1 hypothetical protein [Actinomycetaceae bacterium]